MVILAGDQAVQETQVPIHVPPSMNGEQLYYLSHAVLLVKSAHYVLLNAAGCRFFFTKTWLLCCFLVYTVGDMAFWLESKKSGFFQECWNLALSFLDKSDPINPVITPFSGLWLTHGLIFTCWKCWQELGVPIDSCCLLLPKEHRPQRRWSGRFTGARVIRQNGL